jgi:hypothetical protein
MSADVTLETHYSVVICAAREPEQIFFGVACSLAAGRVEELGPISATTGKSGISPFNFRHVSRTHTRQVYLDDNSQLERPTKV